MNPAGIRQEPWFAAGSEHPVVAAYLIGRLCNAVNWLLFAHALPTVNDLALREVEHLVARVVKLAAIIAPDGTTPAAIADGAAVAGRDLQHEYRDWLETDNYNRWLEYIMTPEAALGNWDRTERLRLAVLDHSPEHVKISLDLGRRVDQGIRPLPGENSWTQADIEQKMGPVIWHEPPERQVTDDLDDLLAVPAPRPDGPPNVGGDVSPTKPQLVDADKLPVVLLPDEPFDPIWGAQVRVLGNQLDIDIGQVAEDATAADATTQIDAKIRTTLAEIAFTPSDAGEGRQPQKRQPAKSSSPPLQSFTQEQLDAAIRDYQKEKIHFYNKLKEQVAKGEKGALGSARRNFGRNAIARALRCKSTAMVSKSPAWRSIAAELGLGKKPAKLRQRVGEDIADEKKSAGQGDTTAHNVRRNETLERIKEILPKEAADEAIAKLESGTTDDDAVDRMLKLYADQSEDRSAKNLHST